jgi:hypothetical protein
MVPSCFTSACTPCALLRRSGGRQAPCRRVKQGRVGGVGLAEPFTQDRVHFPIARSGGEGEDTALLQLVSTNATPGHNRRLVACTPEGRELKGYDFNDAFPWARGDANQAYTRGNKAETDLILSPAQAAFSYYRPGAIGGQCGNPHELIPG